MSKHVGNHSGPVDAAGISGKRVLLPGEIFVPGKTEKSAEVILGKARPYTNEARVGSKQIRGATAEGPNINRWKLSQVYLKQLLPTGHGVERRISL